MRTISIDVPNDKSMKLILDMEQLELIRIRSNHAELPEVNNLYRFKGSMAKQPLEVIEQQLKNLRAEWD